MKLLRLFILCMFLLVKTFNPSGNCQFKSKISIIINDIKYKNGNLIVKYEIENAKTSDNIRVWIDILNSRKDTIFAKTWKGDVNKFVEGGGEKVAIWNVMNDGIELIDYVTIKISGTVEEKFYLNDPIILSTVYPGWGDYKIKPKKPYWLYGALGYSFIGASIGTYISATNNYDKYLNAGSIEDKDNFYSKASLNKNLTYAFIGAASIVWIVDYIGILNRKHEIQKSWKKSLPVKESPSIPGFKISSATSDKILVNTSLTTLQLVEGSLKYADNDENLCLDAFEDGWIEFKLFNYGPARAVNYYAKLSCNTEHSEISFPDSIKLPIIPINQERIIKLPIKASKNLDNGLLNFKIQISAILNNSLPEFNLNVNTCKFNYQKAISESELKSDVDVDIPYVQSKGKERFALIIGNEGYANENTGLSKNFNVPYARHDAMTFKKYAVNILGVKESNIVMLTDAKRKEMYENILVLSDQVSKAKEGAELIFYYAGQGLADTSTLAPYLMPVDIPPGKIKDAISLDFLYKKVWESRSIKSIVILDVSFNNGGRNMGLRGPSTKKIIPRREVISGNTVVFSSVSENYTSNAYREVNHGLFTYYLLKVLKETGGNIDCRQLDNSLKTNVSNRAQLIGTEQVPIAMVSVAVSDIWQNWSIR
ncbi:MAG: caspase family protein [Bacteroidales bacterium]